MNGYNLKKLIEKSYRTEKDISELFGCNIKTIQNWLSKSDKKIFNNVDRNMIKNLFLEEIITKKIQDLLPKIFEKLPSEVILIWLYLSDTKNNKNSIVLLPNTIYNYFEYKKSNSFSISPRIELSMSDDYMNAQVLKSAEPIILTNRGKPSSYTQDRSSESLLKIGIYKPSDRGPIPLVCLDMENKLQKNNNSFDVIRFNSVKKDIFTNDDLLFVKREIIPLIRTIESDLDLLETYK